MKIWAIPHFSKRFLPSDRPLRICMPVYSFYEMDNRVRRYAEFLASQDYCVDVFSLRGSESPKSENMNGVNVYRIQNRLINEKSKYDYLIKLILFFIKSFFFVTFNHLKDPYQYIHVHSVPDFEVFATLVPKLSGAKIILDIHDIVPEFYASKFKKGNRGLGFLSLIWLERLSCWYSDHVIISNHLWRERLISRSVHGNRCTVFMNYPDHRIFYQRPHRDNTSEFVIIYPGTLAKHQGVDIAVRAFEKIRDVRQGLIFKIYGRGPERDALHQLISDLNLEGQVKLYDPVPLEEMANIMADSDLGVVPKRNDGFGGEAFSTKILEFMALGVPVIVSETTIDKYYFNDSVVAFFVPEDISRLAVRLQEMIFDQQKRTRYARSALSYVQGYGWETKRWEYLKLIKSL